MTDEIYFDADCLQSFLWVDRQNIPIQLFRGRIHIPVQVSEELRKVISLRTKLQQLLTGRNVTLVSFENGTPESELYYSLTQKPLPGQKILGRGEASCIALAKYRSGILASNNLADIIPIAQLYAVRYITTGHILQEALNQNIFDMGQGEVIWRDILAHQKMPYLTFAEFLRENKTKAP